MVTPEEARQLAEKIDPIDCIVTDLANRAGNALRDLASQVESLQADAERYRWLRKRSDLFFNLGPTTNWCGGFYPDALDVAIDKARK